MGSPSLAELIDAGWPCAGQVLGDKATGFSSVDLACIWTCPASCNGLQTARNALLALLQQAKQQARQQAQQATTPRGVAYALPPQQQAGGYRPQVSTLPLHSGVTLPSPTHTTAGCPALVAVLNREMLL